MERERKQVIVFPRGQLSANDRRNLFANGIVPVEADDPSKVVQAIPTMTQVVCCDDMLMAAIGALTKGYDSESAMFVKLLYARMQTHDTAGKSA